MRHGVLKAERVRVGRAPRPTGPRAAGGEDAAATPAETPAGIRLRQGPGGLEAIEVDCPCGRHLVFPCVPDGGAPAPGGA